jgi:catechol 2,3-dioxygenase-like lactoylglutathione lyase family enzyme
MAGSASVREGMMKYLGVEHVLLPILTPEATAPFDRLGLRMTPPLALPSFGLETRSIVAGGRTNLFQLGLARVTEPAKARASALGRLITGSAHPAVCAAGFSVPSVREAVRELAARGVELQAEEVIGPDGARLGEMAILASHPEACATIVFVESVTPATWYDELEQGGMLAHSLRLKRLDHLAAVAPDLETATHFWQDVLDIPVWGEVVTPTTVVRQMKVGDAIVELLGPTGPDSPLHTRPPGLNSMTAFEVPNLNDAVATAREHGFAISDPVVGALPGTRVSRIAAEDLSGVALQPLEYV